MNATQPYIAAHKEIALGNNFHNQDSVYDDELGLWVTQDGTPLVLTLIQDTTSLSSTFGETLVTESGEPCDRTDGNTICSQFGETIITKSIENTDQPTAFMSKFGETIITANPNECCD